MQIAIIGSGISGLSFYLWLHKLNLTTTHSVKIYEARPNTTLSTPAQNPDVQTSNASLIGGALGFSPVGLRVLRRLDPELEEEVLKTGHWMARWRMSNARGWVLGETQVQESGGGVLVGREAFWRCLRRRVPDGVVESGRKAVDVRTGLDGCAVRFADGSEVRADLVVGCDGIWSRVRNAVLEKELEPEYAGLTGVGGFVSADKLIGVVDGEMNIVFGANGFFGYGYSSSNGVDFCKHGDVAAWWSTYSLAECPTNWRNIDREDAKSQLWQRHRDWKNNTVRRIMEDVEIDNVYPTFTTPDLPTWERGGCVLVGDAAHALPPSSGQGASMALEDCEILAMLLAEYQAQGRDGCQTATKIYSDMRIPRLRWIRKEAQKRGAMKHDMGVVQEMVMYFFIWISVKIGLFTRYDRELSEYDVPNEARKAVARHSRDVTSAGT